MKSSMLCVSGGINPDIHLFTQSKGLVKWDEKLLTFKPDTPFQNTITLGSVSGNYDYEKTNDEIKKLGKEGVSEDLVRDAEEQVQELTNQFTKKFDSIFATKEAEIMTV